MVRLEINWTEAKFYSIKNFTFQYGQIRNSCQLPIYYQVEELYIPVWLDQKYYYDTPTPANTLNLHSSMVRLEILFSVSHSENLVIFTFQYGQIRNMILIFEIYNIIEVYIPVWLDQKFKVEMEYRFI